MILVRDPEPGFRNRAESDTAVSSDGNDLRMPRSHTLLLRASEKAVLISITYSDVSAAALSNVDVEHTLSIYRSTENVCVE